jgi:hypothetical protein
MKSAKIFFGLIGTAGGFFYASAQELDDENVGTNTVAGINGSMTFPQFNPNLGTLDYIRLQMLGGSCVIDWQGGNSTANAYDFDSAIMCQWEIDGPGLEIGQITDFYLLTPIQLNPNSQSDGSYTASFPSATFAPPHQL